MDPKPSVAGDSKSASSASATNAANATDSSINPNQVIVLVTVLAMAGIVVFFVWQRKTPHAKPRYVGAEIPRTTLHAGVGASGGFCTQCGNAMAAGDKFCARCGSRTADVQ